MSEMVISRTPSNAPSSRSNSAMNRMLLWKEMRQLGVYAFAIMIPSLAFLLLLPLMLMFGWPGGSQDSLIQAVRVIPLLVTLAAAASTFSIEHENQSFQFLRSLPFSSGRIVATKMLVAAAYGLLAALIFWPIAHFIRPSSAPESLIYEVLTVSMALGSVFLWAIYASLSCRTVLNAITKSMIGFVLFFFVPENISLFDLDVDHDLFYWILEIVSKLASSLFLIVMIAVKSRTWCKDREAWRPRSFAMLNRAFEIKTCSPVTRMSPLWRLVWLQRRTGLLIFISMVPICLLLRMLLITVTPVASSYPPSFLSRIAFLLVVCSGVMGSVVFNGIQSAKSFLIQQNYRPSLIWLSQIAAPLSCCIIVGLAADLSVFGESPRLLYFTEWIVVGFSIGQLFSMLCRTYVVAISFTLLTLWATFLFNNYLAGALNHYWLSWTLLICLPIVATFFHRQIWLYGRPMSWALNVGLASVAILTLLQIPLYRNYEIPWVSKSEVLARLPQGIDVNQNDLDRFRTLMKNLPSLDSTNVATDEECEFGEAILANSGGEILITGPAPTYQDSVYFQSATTFLVRLMLKPIHGSSDRHHKLKLKILESWPGSLRIGFFGFDEAIALAQDERTSVSDIQQLILALENEDCFDCYRYLIAMVYRHALKNPDRAEMNYESRKRSDFESILFWEQARKQRVIHYSAATALTCIDELEKSQRRSETQEAWLERQESFLPPKYRALMKLYPKFNFAVEGDSFFRPLRGQRAVKVGLAIVAWQKENNGQFPESLDQLVGKYLKSIPYNPMNGTPFYFSPRGLSDEHINADGPTRFLHNLGKDTDGKSRGANQPFIWLNEWRSEKMPTVERLPAINTVEELKKKGRTNEQNYVLFYVIPQMKKRPQE